jgi:hypothetical protein
MTEKLVGDTVTVFAHYTVKAEPLIHHLYVLVRPTIHNEEEYQKVEKALLQCKDRRSFIEFLHGHREYFRVIVDTNVFFHEYFDFNIRVPYNKVCEAENGGKFVILDFGTES